MSPLVSMPALYSAIAWRALASVLKTLLLATYASVRDFLSAVTTTFAVALAPSHVQVIVAVPAVSAVTRPSLETVATS